jgi:hypothetical protein
MPPIAITLLINLLPALSVVAFGWGVFTLVLLYWIENVVIGGFNVLRILTAGFAKGRTGVVAGLMFAPFFIFHYGLFCIVHGVFIVMLFGGGLMGEPPPFATMGLWDYLIALPHNDPALFWNVILLFGFQIFLFLRYWIGDELWRKADLVTQMFAPYPRLIVVHLTILIAGLPVVLLGQPVIAVLSLALLKTGLETGRLRLFDMAAESPVMGGKLKNLRDHTRH